MLVKETFTFEQKGKGRERLLALEKQGCFVFHGSPDALTTLAPRQAYNRNEETGEMEKDGEPAVFATPFADAAIFRALINEKGVGGETTSEFGFDGEKLHFAASGNLLAAAKKKTGKVYVLDKREFDAPEGMQCRSEQTVTPREVIEVTFEDLPADIKRLKK